MARNRKQRRKLHTFAEPASESVPVTTPERFEGAGMEDLDAALVVAPDDEIDWNDPDAKAAWLELLTEAKIEGDDGTVQKLADMVPTPSLT